MTVLYFIYPQIDAPEAAAAQQQFLRLADVIIFEIPGHEVAAKQAAVDAGRMPVSHILTYRTHKQAYACSHMTIHPACTCADMRTVIE